ncbi:hypothetical protein D3C86_2160570 [compost metagenome]
MVRYLSTKITSPRNAKNASGSITQPPFNNKSIKCNSGGAVVTPGFKALAVSVSWVMVSVAL